MTAAENAGCRWLLQTPPGCDLNALAAQLNQQGIDFVPDRDQVALGQEHGGYAMAQNAALFQEAFQEAFALENQPWPERLPRWRDLDCAARSAILQWLAESPAWAESGRFHRYSEAVTEAAASGQLQLFNLT